MKRIFRITATVEIEEITPDAPVKPEPPILFNPTKPEEPKPQPQEPSVVDWINITESFYRELEDPACHEILLLPGKKYRVDRVKNVPVGKKIFIRSTAQRAATRPILLIGPEKYETWKGGHSGHLIDLLDGANVVICNVDVCLPPQIKTSQPYAPALFKAPQSAAASWTVAVVNCDTTRMGKNGGWGLGFLYGGQNENHAALINYVHAGGGLMDGKNPYPKSVLAITMENVDTDFVEESDYGSTQQLCMGRIDGNVFTITSPDVTTDIFMPNYQFAGNGFNANETFLIHINRFTFLWGGSEAIINSKQVRLRNPVVGKQVFRVINGRAYFPHEVEPHAGQTFTVDGQINQLLTKDRTEGEEWVNWIQHGHKDRIGQLVCTLASPLPDGVYTGTFDGVDLNLPPQPVYLIAKQNFLFKTDLKTTFGWWQILQSNIVGHLCYNHSNISIWAKNVKLNGYYRQTDGGQGDAKWMNLVDCNQFEPEFNPDIPITRDKDYPMPERIVNLMRDMNGYL